MNTIEIMISTLHSCEASIGNEGRTEQRVVKKLRELQLNKKETRLDSGDKDINKLFDKIKNPGGGEKKTTWSAGPFNRKNKDQYTYAYNQAKTLAKDTRDFDEAEKKKRKWVSEYRNNIQPDPQVDQVLRQVAQSNRGEAPFRVSYLFFQGEKRTAAWMEKCKTDAYHREYFKNKNWCVGVKDIVGVDGHLVASPHRRPIVENHDEVEKQVRIFIVHQSGAPFGDDGPQVRDKPLGKQNSPSGDAQIWFPSGTQFVVEKLVHLTKIPTYYDVPSGQISTKRIYTTMPQRVLVYLREVDRQQKNPRNMKNLFNGKPVYEYKQEKTNVK